MSLIPKKNMTLLQSSKFAKKGKISIAQMKRIAKKKRNKKRRSKK
tara:strand:- start:1398 stop:1532 length:135 start_codon:yes stop_codon:yes gene_type:complete